MLRLTEHIQQANTLSILHAEYASPRTIEAFEVIEDFLEEHGASQYYVEYLKLHQSRDKEWRKIDRSRRRLVHWFSRLHHFYTFGYLSSKYLAQFPGPERAEHFIDLVEPLEHAHHRSTGRKLSDLFDFLRKIYKLPAKKMQLDASTALNRCISRCFSQFNTDENNNTEPQCIPVIDSYLEASRQPFCYNNLKFPI